MSIKNIANKEEKIMAYISPVEVERRFREVQELKAQGYSRTEIRNKTGLPKTCIDRYWNGEVKSLEEKLMNPKTGQKLRVWDKKPIFKKYEPLILEQLRAKPDIKMAPLMRIICDYYQIEEIGIRYGTFREFVAYLRETNGIDPNAPKNTRRFYSIDDEGPGNRAYVDMGQKTLQDMYGNNKKVYMWAIVLGYSRMKYVYFQDRPFTSMDFIRAHEYAFQYFGGVPKQITYDQDRVMVYGENYGEIIYQKKFKEYKETVGFDVYICRGQDPDSKGKVENVIKYIKYNFLKDFTYQGMQNINGKALEWLDTIGNGLVHGTTKKVPLKEFKKEQPCLMKHVPYKLEEFEQRILSVNALNEVTYNKNYYSVPYELKKPKDKVRVEAKDGILYIYCPETNDLLCMHKILKGIGGMSIQASRPEHQLKPKVEAFKMQFPFYREYLETLMDEVPRYFYDQFLMLLEARKRYGEQRVKNAICVSMKKNIYSVPKLIEMLAAADGEAILRKIVPARTVKHYMEQAKGYEKYAQFINEGIDEKGLKQLELEMKDELDMKNSPMPDEINYQIENLDNNEGEIK